MKIQCDVCERAAAAVLCCADEAALCWGCDEKVHAANKLAGMHQRVPLLLPANSSSSSSHIPSCDICQEKAGYFFCLEDRAMLCRQCDVTIHTASPYVSSHRRFLITGVRVGLQDKITSNCNNSSSCSNSSNSTLRSAVSTESIADKMVTEEGVKSQWPWHELLDSLEFDQRYRLSNPGSFS
ncbi:hypothetical protein C4D60_Mb10t13840 [Musa balbisiana]|uniref:B box-type domain-containing protein n=1 Tax=Musa balbisiana TaxID=52838 RepID=A0A4S8IX14_MUSBA|nr:hypothetical protein C4D60_Mb10t13840 [Musa balbisiana]